ncbi:MAG: peroxide stress protein YaaA [Spongiibacteraceae bacterium]
MLIVISPAKTLDFDTPSPLKRFTQPLFLDRSQELITILRTYDPTQISTLMGISDKLGELNWQRFQEWTPAFTPANAKQALLAFRGDVYTGLDADRFAKADFDYAQKHLRILSGLYGLLKPLDLMQAYRLEMGTTLPNPRGRNLYEFWGDQVTDALNLELAKMKKPVLINLASEEYFKAVRPKQLAGTVLTPHFKERKGSAYKIVSFFAKKARGLMSAYIVKNRIEAIDDLKDFAVDGYRFNAALSRDRDWVFTRDDLPEKICHE